uniref:Uncharacterized protein n=1 Tax=Candidatus Berkiella aquae TaxID=295108 RepID=A0A0Q9YMW0_9GAMM
MRSEKQSQDDTWKALFVDKDTSLNQIKER